MNNRNEPGDEEVRIMDDVNLLFCVLFFISSLALIARFL